MTSGSARLGMLTFSLTLLGLLADVRLFSQVPAPRPNVAVMQLRTLSANPTPGDFNGDGRTDLVSGRSEADGRALVLRLGNGDGTFAAEQVIATPAPAAPLAVADFNADGALDVLAVDKRDLLYGSGDLRAIWIIPGRGDGTFVAAISVDALPAEPFFGSPPSAVAADFDGDSRLDLAIAAETDRLHFYPGNGDFTFDAKVTMVAGAAPSAVTAADLNGDGRADVVVAARDGRQVDVFLNGGGFSFGSFTIPLDRAALGVTTGDLNRDGKADLLVSAATEDVDFRWFFHNGQVLVMMGNGDGTFQPPAAYQTPRGPLAIVAGDFNRDGLDDVATGNQPGADQEECGPHWGSVSIFPGNGSGALGTAASFQLSYDPADDNYATQIRSLRAGRLDGDALPDLVAPGGVLLNRAPTAVNRPPTANAGPDRTISDHNPIQLIGQAADPDNDRLTYRWTDSAGRTVDICLHPLVRSPGPGQHTYTLTVDDGRGGIVSDSITITDTSTNNGPWLSVHRPQFNNPVPAGAPYLIRWTATDPDGGQIVDLDIAVDRNGQSNFTPIPGCTNLSGHTSECVWEDPGPPSADAALLFHVVDSQGDVNNSVVRFQIVDRPRGALPGGWSHGDVGAVSAVGDAAFDGSMFTVRGSGADIWGTADEFHWAYLSATGDFEARARVAIVQNIDRWTKAGLMVREFQAAGSRHASIFATPGTERPVSFQRRPATAGPSVSTAGTITKPPLWLVLRRTGDVISAFYTTADGQLTLLGTQTLSGLAATVHVGLAVSSHVDGTLATAAFDNVTVIRRVPVGLTVLRPALDERVQTNAPDTIRWMPDGEGTGIARFNVFFSSDGGATWAPIPECANVPGDARSCIWFRPSPQGPGLIKVVATTSQGFTGEDTSEPFQIVLAAGGPNGLPPGWSCGDAGAVAATGSCAYEVDDELWPDFVIRGSGADIWGTADEFSYASYAAYGDFSITARVLGVEHVNRWTKAGIMIRDWNGQSAAPADSRHASFFVTPSLEKGTAFQRRPEQGGPSVSTPGPVTTAPVWLKLIRTGDTVRAYYRLDPLGPWSFLAEQVFSGLPYQLSAMLVVSSHVDGTLAEARFDNVVVDDHEPMRSADIGATAPGATAANGPQITIAGNGADIWGTADAFRFHYTRWRGDGFVIARVRSVDDTHAWSKAGVMIRETLDPGSKHAMAIVSASRGLAMQSRATTNGVSAGTGSAAGAAPVWLMLRRFGDHFTSY